MQPAPEGTTIKLICYGDGVGWIVPVVNWATALAFIIEDARDGDTVLCRSDATVQLGQRAHSRMCPQKNLVFAVFVQQPTTAT